MIIYLMATKESNKENGEPEPFFLIRDAKMDAETKMADVHGGRSGIQVNMKDSENL